MANQSINNGNQWRNQRNGEIMSISKIISAWNGNNGENINVYESVMYQ
jgi:hypothetical protein